MSAGLPFVIALLAQLAGAPAPAGPAATSSAAPVYGPVLPAPPKPPPKVAAPKAAEPCRTAPPSADATEILVCAERPQGYRLNPDLVEAKRQMRGLPRRRSMEHMKDTACATVGPMGCIAAPGINLVGAALTLASMATKAVRGENVGKMFITRPEPTEYDLYVEAKREREAEEAAAAAKVKAVAATGTTPNP